MNLFYSSHENLRRVEGKEVFHLTAYCRMKQLKPNPYSYFSERTIFLQRGLRRWRRSRRTPRPRRTTRSPPPTPTTAVTGTTPKPATTPTPTLATMGKASQLGAGLVGEWAEPTQTVGTLSQLPRLWWSPPILRPLWRAATVRWVIELHQPHPHLLLAPPPHMCRAAHIRTQWARQCWNAWAPCPSWFPLRAGRVLWSNTNLRWTNWIFTILYTNDAISFFFPLMNYWFYSVRVFFLH